MRTAIDFSNPESVEKAFSAIQEDIEKKNTTTDEEKEKNDAIKKALTNPKVAKLLAKIAEDDKDIKEAMEKDEDIKNAIKKANDDNNDNNDDKNKNSNTDDKNKDADEKDEDLKAIVSEFKAKLITELVASHKSFGASDKQIENYTKILNAKTYKDVKSDYEGSEVQRNFIAQTINMSQLPQKEESQEPRMPFNASYSDNSAPEGVYI